MLVLKHALGDMMAFEVLLLYRTGGDMGGGMACVSALRLPFPFFMVYDIDFLKDGVTLLLLLLLWAVLIGLTLISSSSATTSLKLI